MYYNNKCIYNKCSFELSILNNNKKKKHISFHKKKKM